MRQRFIGNVICHVKVDLALIASPIGPAGDTLYVPLRITGGVVTGLGADKAVLGGSDFALMHADERLTHCGRFVARDCAGDILFWYDGTSDANEGAYDELLDLRLPGRIPARLIVRTVSTHPEWRSLNRRPLVGIGTVDAAAGELDFVLQTVP